MTSQQVRLSRLPKTWIVDIDGVILKHNGYRQGGDEILPGAREFWRQIGQDDVVVLISAREARWRELTLEVLSSHGFRFDHALFGLPVGERILINDDKPSGLSMAHALNIPRDQGLCGIAVAVDDLI